MTSYVVIEFIADWAGDPPTTVVVTARPRSGQMRHSATGRVAVHRSGRLS